MRGELLAVRDGMPDEHWLDLAKVKFNLNEDPFVQPEQRIQDEFDALLDDLLSISPDKHHQNKENEIPVDEPIVVIEHNLSKEENLDSDCLIRMPDHCYSREDIIQIQQDWPQEKWLEYTTNKWNTKEDPWVMDAAMRCSMTEQIRKQRDAEKQARIKVMKQREEACKRDEIISSSRTITTPTIEASSWEDFCDQIQKDFEAFKLAPLNNLGSVVPVRDSPAVWKERVNFYADWCNNLEANFARDIRLSMGMINDQGIATDDTFLEDILDVLKISVDPDEDASNYETAPEESDSKDMAEETENYGQQVQIRSETRTSRAKIKKESTDHEELDNTEGMDEQQPSVDAPCVENPLFASVYNRYFSLLGAYCQSH